MLRSSAGFSTAFAQSLLADGAQLIDGDPAFRRVQTISMRCASAERLVVKGQTTIVAGGGR